MGGRPILANPSSTYVLRWLGAAWGHRGSRLTCGFAWTCEGKKSAGVDLGVRRAGICQKTALGLCEVKKNGRKATGDGRCGLHTGQAGLWGCGILLAVPQSCSAEMVIGGFYAQILLFKSNKMKFDI